MAVPTFSTRTSFSIAQSAVTPFDTIGAVGEDHIVVVLNDNYLSFNKAGTELQNTDLNALFGDIEENDAFDPRVVYDSDEQRFFACAADGRAASAGSQLLIAVSNSADPTAGWTAFAVDTGQDIGGVEQHWPDFPMLGFNGSVVTVSLKLLSKTIGSPTPDNHGHNAMYVFPKSDLVKVTPDIAGLEEFINAEQVPAFIKIIHPHVDLENDSTPHSSWQWSEDTSTGKITRWDVTEDSGFSFDEITDVEYLGRGGLHGEQPESATDLDNAHRFRIGTNPVKQGGFVYVVVNGRDGTDCTIVVIKINYTTNVIATTTILHESGLDLIYPSIAVNGNGHIVVGCTSTGAGAGDFASVMIFVGNDDGTTMTFSAGQKVKDGERTYEVLVDTRNRWGDYSAVVFDPTDENRFWVFQTWAFDNLSNDNGRKVEVTEVIVEPVGFLDLFELTMGWGASSPVTAAADDVFRVFAETTEQPVFTAQATAQPRLFAQATESPGTFGAG